MPRYYFNLLDGRASIIDTDGVDLDELPVEHVLQILEEIRTEERPQVVHKWVGWRLEIVGADGQTLHVVPL